MITRMLFLLLVMQTINFSIAKEGTVFKESCQFITFVFQYFLEDGADSKTIVIPTQSTLQKFQAFISLRPTCANFTKEEFHDFQRAKETEHLVAEITFIIYAKDEIIDILERETVPNVCAEQINIILSTPAAQEKLLPLIPRNISGTIENAESVGIKKASCCKRLYKQPSQDRACCKPGFVEFGENCTCVAGTFLDLDMTTCEPCPKDTYQPDQASTRCKPCPNGTTTYTTTGAKHVSTCLKACSPGERFNLAIKGCTICPKDTYQPLEGQVLCLTCPNNTTTNHTGNKNLSDCVQSCSPGSFYNFKKENCEFCPRDSYQPSKGQFNCMQCDSSRVTMRNGSDSRRDCILDCKQGSFYDFNTTTCRPCPLNFFQNLRQQLNCSLCPEDKITLTISSSSAQDCIKNCTPGSAFNYTTQDCQKCPLNSFQPQSGTAECIACPNGTITVNVSSSTIQDCIENCSPGSAFNSSTQNCKKCPLNSFQPQSGKTNCILCPAGKITTNVSSSSVQDCIKNCPPGSAFNHTIQDCQQCPLNFFQSHFGKTECTPCPVGNITLNVSSSSLQDCIHDCPPGSAFNYTVRDCQKCPLNSFQPQSGTTECIACSNGTITVNVSSSRLQDCIKNCPAGSTFNNTIRDCQQCPLNFFQSHSGKTECIPCPVGTITLNVSSSSLQDCIKDCPPGSAFNYTVRDCQKCSLNSFQPQSGTTECIACPNGTITVNVSSSRLQDCIKNCSPGSAFNHTIQDCQKCPLNFYQTESGRTQCIPCTAGKITVNISSSRLQDCIEECDAGTKYDHNKTRCVDCPMNTYQPHRGQVKCTACPSGWITYKFTNTNERDCIEVCKQGEFFDLLSRNCSKCQRNFTQGNTGEIKCFRCPDGRITEDEGATDEIECIVECPSGQFYNKDQLECQLCSKHHYQPKPGTSKCLQCPNKTVAFKKGSKSVKDCIKACPPGSHHMDETSQCAGCDTSSYQNKFGQTQCEPCQPIDYKTFQENSTKSEDCYQVCRAGYYHNNNKTRTCVECDSHTYQPFERQFSCIQCPNGTMIGLSFERTSIDNCVLDCDEGYSYDSTSKICFKCPLGTYKPTPGHQDCFDCDAGLTTAKTGSLQFHECIPNCTVGHYFYPNTSRNCDPCPLGEYQPSSAQDRCLKCREHQTTETTKSVTSQACYQDCERGHYYNSTLLECAPCPRGQYQQLSGQKRCKRCMPSILTTYQEGSVSVVDCTTACRTGEFYNETAKKCKPCPLNTYQNLSAAISCQPCPDIQITATTETKTIEGCLIPKKSLQTSDNVTITIVVPVSAVAAFAVLLLLLSFLYRRRLKEAIQGRSISARRLNSGTSFGDGPSTLDGRRFNNGRLDSVASMPNHHYKLKGNGLKPVVIRPNTRSLNIPEHLEIARENLRFVGEVLGKGNFGRVEKAVLSKDEKETVVAVKMIKGGGSFSDEKELFDELEMLASLAPYPHQNIVNLIGGTKSNDGPLFVAVEYCANGNLLKYLQRNQTRYDPKPEYVNILPKAPKPSIQYHWKLNNAIEICNGMAHLAKHKIIHRDVAARNVLLDENYMAKISDFGMARDVYVQQIYRKDTEGFLPVRWMAIESLESFIYTTQSDVWSFGILLWEIITDGRVPYNNILDHTQLLNYIKSGRIMKRPKGCPKDYYHIMQKCWATTPSNRPLFENLIREIELLYDQEMRKDEALPQRIFRRFSSKRKSRKSEEVKEGNSSTRGSGRKKLRLQNSLSNTSASKIDKIEEELGSEKDGGNSMKMQVLETPDREETVTKERVNKGYDKTGSVTSDNLDSGKNNNVGVSGKEERGEGRSENVLDELLLKSSQNRKASCSEKKTGESSKDVIKNDTPSVSKPENATESLTLETIPEKPLASDLRPSIKGEEHTEGLTNADVSPTRNQDIEDVISVETCPEAPLEFISHRRPWLTDKKQLQKDVSEIDGGEPDENIDSVILETNLGTPISRPDIRWDERSDSDSLTSSSLRGDVETGYKSPIASGESDDSLSGNDNWSNQFKELDTSSGC